MVNVCIQLVKTSLDDITIFLDGVAGSAVGGTCKACHCVTVAFIKLSVNK